MYTYDSLVKGVFVLQWNWFQSLRFYWLCWRSAVAASSLTLMLNLLQSWSSRLEASAKTTLRTWWRTPRSTPRRTGGGRWGPTSVFFIIIVIVCVSCLRHFKLTLLVAGPRGGCEHGRGHRARHRVQDGGVQRPAASWWGNASTTLIDWLIDLWRTAWRPHTGIKKILRAEGPSKLNCLTANQTSSALLRPLAVRQAEGGDCKGPWSPGQQGLGNGREHQAGGQHPAAVVPQTLWNGLQEGRRWTSAQRHSQQPECGD